MLEEDSYDFSFSGLFGGAQYLKSAQTKTYPSRSDIAASFQQAVLDVLLDKSFRLLKETGRENWLSPEYPPMILESKPKTARRGRRNGLLSG